MFVGDKGKILAGFRVESPRLIPERRMSGYGAAAAAARRRASPRQLSPGLRQWVAACRGGAQSPGSFLNAGGISEAVNLYAVALRTRQPPASTTPAQPQDHQRRRGQQISLARVPQGLESRIRMNLRRRQFLGAAGGAAAGARAARRSAGHADRLPDVSGARRHSAKDFEGTLKRTRRHRLQDHRDVLAAQLRGFRARWPA